MKTNLHINIKKTTCIEGLWGTYNYYIGLLRCYIPSWASIFRIALPSFWVERPRRPKGEGGPKNSMTTKRKETKKARKKNDRSGWEKWRKVACAALRLRYCPLSFLIIVGFLDWVVLDADPSSPPPLPEPRHLECRAGRECTTHHFSLPPPRHRGIAMAHTYQILLLNFLLYFLPTK